MTTQMLPLNTGAKIPALGFGTWQSPPGEVKKAVLHALRVGYKHIDCAYVYGNEEEIGEAFQEAFDTGIVKREDIFVTTKLWCTWHTRVEDNLDVSLKRLRLDYVDLYLVHWPVVMNPNKGTDFPKNPDGSRDLLPNSEWNHLNTWAEMEKLPATGKVKAIGVANYSVAYLKDLLAGAKVTPAANQIENHPYLPQQEIVDFCNQQNIHVTAYSPLGSTGSPLFKEEQVSRVADRRGVSVGCVLLSYHIARGSSVLAKSVTPSRIEQNMKIIELDAQDMADLNAIHKDKSFTRYVYPAFGVDLKFPDKSSAVAAL